MDGLTPVRGPDPGELFRNTVRPAGERAKRQSKPHKPHDEPETGESDGEQEVQPVSEDLDPIPHGIDVEA